MTPARCTWWAKRDLSCLAKARYDEPTAQSIAPDSSMAHKFHPSAFDGSDHSCLRFAFATDVAFGPERPGAAPDCARVGESAGLGVRLLTDCAWAGESPQAPCGCVCFKSHFVHGHAGDLCRVALPVSHSGDEETVAGSHHWMVVEQVRPDSHRHGQSGSNAVKPRRGDQGSALRHAVVYLP